MHSNFRSPGHDSLLREKGQQIGRASECRNVGESQFEVKIKRKRIAATSGRYSINAKVLFTAGDVSTGRHGASQPLSGRRFEPDEHAALITARSRADRRVGDIRLAKPERRTITSFEPKCLTAFYWSQPSISIISGSRIATFPTKTGYQQRAETKAGEGTDRVDLGRIIHINDG